MTLSILPVVLAVASAQTAMASTAPVAATSETQPKPAVESRVLRVCSDPNNLPFSNEEGEGFENKLAELLARELDATLEYTWWAQRRGFFRETLKAKRCDVVMGTPTSIELAATSRPYYRSGYAFVLGPRAPKVSSLDAPELRTLRIGVPVLGDDGANPPPVHALAARGITQNVVGYSVYGDYSLDSPPAEVVRAVGRGEVDLAITWGPVAGYFAHEAEPALRVRLLSPEEAVPSLPFVFPISLAVRHGDEALLEELERVMAKRREEIAAILDAYHVPRLDGPHPAGAADGGK